VIPDVGSLLAAAPDAKDPKTIATKVQAMFMEVMIKAMEDSVGAEDGLYGDNSTSEIYRGMFREQLGATLGDQIGGSLRAELEKGMKAAEKSLNPDGLAVPAELNALPVPPPLPAPVPLHSALPVSGVVTSEVGWRKDPFTGALAFHKGTDIAAPAGTPIHAVASGLVLESGAKGEYGNAVVIQTDDGRRMLYGHNSANFVRAGERVTEGEAIATVGATGRATGPHVHFEVTE
jgi:murein DD-endopeptidase MepM/ murein hydrolase activator NlpD